MLITNQHCIAPGLVLLYFCVVRSTIHGSGGGWLGSWVCSVYCEQQNALVSICLEMPAFSIFYHFVSIVQLLCDANIQMQCTVGWCHSADHSSTSLSNNNIIIDYRPANAECTLFFSLLSCAVAMRSIIIIIVCHLNTHNRAGWWGEEAGGEKERAWERDCFRSNRNWIADAVTFTWNDLSAQTKQIDSIEWTYDDGCLEFRFSTTCRCSGDAFATIDINQHIRMRVR